MNPFLTHSFLPDLCQFFKNFVSTPIFILFCRSFDAIPYIFSRLGFFIQSIPYHSNYWNEYPFFFSNRFSICPRTVPTHIRTITHESSRDILTGTHTHVICHKTRIILWVRGGQLSCVPMGQDINLIYILQRCAVLFISRGRWP